MKQPGLFESAEFVEHVLAQRGRRGATVIELRRALLTMNLRAQLDALKSSSRARVVTSRDHHLVWCY